MTGECETELFDKTTSIKKRDCCKKEILQQSRYSISPKVPLHGKSYKPFGNASEAADDRSGAYCRRVWIDKDCRGSPESVFPCIPENL